MAGPPRDQGTPRLTPASAPQLEPLDPKELRWRCTRECIANEVAKEDVHAGSDDAVSALRFGMEQPGRGLNVYLSGRVGTRRLALIQALHPTLRSRRTHRPDRLYVHDFLQPTRPRLLEVEAGLGRELVADLEKLAAAPDRASFATMRERWSAPELLAWLDEAERGAAAPGAGHLLRGNLLSEGYWGLAPLVEEPVPTWENLFGTFAPSGGQAAGALDLRGGSLLAADGGWLVVRAEDLIHRGSVWAELLRVLHFGELEIRRPADGPADGVRPTPIPLDPRVLMLGNETAYAELFDGNRQFPNIFKVKTTFEGRLPRTPTTLARHVAVAHGIVAQGALPIDEGAINAICEEAARESGDRRFVTARFSWTEDLVRHADHVARTRGADQITANDVYEAENAERRRLGIRDRWVREDAIEGRILIDTVGARVGVVNGLAVHDYGNLGKVCRITATVGPGTRGIVNVEREVSLSASSYDKGIFILAGYLSWRLASEQAAPFTARLVFEQSYGGITGDSATMAETVAILSALSDLPVRQDLAITGSMNQHGEAQSIGGVNEKIEGFFELCRA
ncbi:MAG: AAA family ATPase, partial [Deltaproteobacteria bacterium]|nr:AAA family ATPase [Deltaproteobacteria bacterium]